jgi:hypothetical protein
LSAEASFPTAASSPFPSTGGSPPTSAAPSSPPRSHSPSSSGLAFPTRPVPFSPPSRSARRLLQVLKRNHRCGPHPQQRLLRFPQRLLGTCHHCLRTRLALDGSGSLPAPQGSPDRPHPRRTLPDRPRPDRPSGQLSVPPPLARYFNSNNGWRIAVAVFSFVLALILLVMCFVYKGEIALQGIFLEYAKTFLHDWSGVYAYIPLFILLEAGFIALFMFQHLAFSSSQGTYNSDFWNFTNPGVLGIFNILEFIWGFQFLRDACTHSSTQSTSASLAAPPIGTGTPATPGSLPRPPDSSPATGAASWPAPL